MKFYALLKFITPEVKFQTPVKSNIEPFGFAKLILLKQLPIPYYRDCAVLYVRNFYTGYDIFHCDSMKYV